MTPTDGARITVYPNGPLIVRGNFVLDDLDEGAIETGRSVALCRCGRSATKPLCDGSHKVSGLRVDEGLGSQATGTA